MHNSPVNALVNNLVSLAVEDYPKKQKYSSPDAFAKTAAHLAVFSAATDREATLPDAVVLMEALSTLAIVFNAVDYTCKLCDAGLQLAKTQTHYRALLFPNQVYKMPVSGETATVKPFVSMLNSEQLSSLINQAAQACATFNAQQELVKDKPDKSSSLRQYMHAYTAARAAYVHAVGMAARHTDSAKQKKLFEQALKSRLHADLIGEPMSPSFFLTVVSSEQFKYIGIALLMIGMLALSIELTALASASAALYVTALGLHHSTLLITGVSGSTLGLTNLSTRFFTQKKWQQDNQLSLSAMQASNHGSGATLAGG